MPILNGINEIFFKVGEQRMTFNSLEDLNRFKTYGLTIAKYYYKDHDIP